MLNLLLQAALVMWAGQAGYLPDPNLVAPWGGLHPMQALHQEEAPISAASLFESYQAYSQSLQAQDQQSSLSTLNSTIIRHLVPAYGGPTPQQQKAMPAEIEAGINYLQQIPLAQFEQALDLLERQFETRQLSPAKRFPIRSRIRGWQNWQTQQQAPAPTAAASPSSPAPSAEIQFNTHYTPGVHRQQHQPGQQMTAQRCPVHALGAQAFPADYLNPTLQTDLQLYETWRATTEVTPGGLKTELAQIHQLLGWLVRYEQVSLAVLSFEQLIRKMPLQFRIADYDNYEHYARAKEGGIQSARSQADQDVRRVQRYLDFVGQSAWSRLRRLFIVLCIAKFVYRDILGSEEFPEERDLPIVRRLLNLQNELKQKAKLTPPTIPYGATSVSWEDAVRAMELERQRADQLFVYIRRPATRRGYVEQRRPDSEIADDLQRFLSIALQILIPSRSRTFYDLRIGETWRAGILTERGIISVEELQRLGKFEPNQDRIRFYIYHSPQDYKSGKAMSQELLENGGWCVEIPNVHFGAVCLYDYIDRWLHWGRHVAGAVPHNFFFRRVAGVNPIDGNAWNHRIKKIFGRWTGVQVPPKNVRKMVASEFPEYTQSAALLLQHSEKMHKRYDMRLCTDKVKPVLEANVLFIETAVMQLKPTFRTSNWHIQYFNEAIGVPEVASRELSQEYEVVLNKVQMVHLN